MNDGGPAFPVDMDGEEGYTQYRSVGISKRDFFAGMALIGELAADPNDKKTESLICQRAWNMADAMLKEREK